MSWWAWLELDGSNLSGQVLALSPTRDDANPPVQKHLIVEPTSK